MAGKVLSTIGFMKVQMKIMSGTCLKEYGDGSDGKMVAMSCFLINLKLDGTTFQTVALTPNRILDMVNSTQSTFITTTFTPMLTDNQEKLEELRLPTQVNSFKRVDSLMNQDGELLKYKNN
jgi:hypothetical protein